jgi:hypothetical protein
VGGRFSGLAGQEALNRSWLEQAGGDREEAARLRSEYFSELGKRSGSRRRAIAAARRAAKIAELEAAAGLRFTTVDELARLAGERFMRWLSQLRRFVVGATRFCENELVLGNELVATLRAVLPRRDPGVSGWRAGCAAVLGGAHRARAVTRLALFII